MLRTLLERISRNRVLRKRLPSRLGGDTVFVSPDSALRYWRWNLDMGSKDLFDFAEEFVKPGHVVWDVGANLGMFTFASAYRAGASGQIVAMEPDTFLVDLLRKSAAARSVKRAKTIILPAAVSDSLGIAELNVANRGRSANYLTSLAGSSQTGGVRQAVAVITTTLDWLADRLPLPDVVKIDVEGAEAGVLKGGERVFSEAKPVVLCEVSEENIEFCTRFFNSRGYELYDADNPDRCKIGRAVFNTLAICQS